MRNTSCLLLFLLFSDCTLAGVMPSRSRVVYVENDKEQSLMLANTNAYPVIVQTWVDNGEGTPDAKNIPFFSLPPVFELDPHAVKGVRIIYNPGKLPHDKESLYWYNIYEVPPLKKTRNIDNSVVVTMNTQIKTIFRPAGIKTKPEETIKKVNCQQTNLKTVECINSSPIYLSLISVNARTTKNSIFAEDSDLMMAPLSKKKFHFKSNINAEFTLKFIYVNDFGENLFYENKKSTR